jgi:ABC-type branched-subunit amino acid transport system substrate-binding protein
MQRKPLVSIRGYAACKRRAKRRPPALLPLSLLSLFSSIACVSTNESRPPPDALRIGTVLPFSGERASSGVALESAMRLAIELVNSAGGLAGRPLWLDVRDSHSSEDRGAANALSMIDQDLPQFFIGTEEPRITFQITSAIKTHQMVHLMPGLTSVKFHDPSAQAAWLRLSPEVRYIACALAKHMRADGIKKAGAVIGADDYSSSFATIFGRVFSYNGGVLAPTINLGSSTDALFANLNRYAPDAAVLVTSPAVAAEIMQEWAVRDKPIKWYLGPTLNTLELLRNVPLGLLDGVEGISADLGERAGDFDAYLETITGVPPFPGVHYYFDAVALLALAVQEAIAQSGTFPSPPSIKDHIRSVTSPGGTVVSFDQLSSGMALVASGQKIEYHGAAGAYVIDPLGDTTQNRGTVWQISGTSFAVIDYLQCVPTEVESGATLQ